MPPAAILDIDGTLVDSNYHHVIAWYRALRGQGLVLPLWRIHRAIGMGGDQLVEALAGEQVERRYGDDLREAWVEEFDPMLGEIKALEGATELLDQLRRRGFKLVLASSGKPQHVEHFLELIDGRSYAQAWTTSQDVEATKPAPDLMAVAVGKVDGARGVALGDSTWDFVAAKKLDLPTIAVRTGGFSDAELQKAGADQVFDSLPELVASIDDTAFRAAD